jgi:hypothetical protein
MTFSFPINITTAKDRLAYWYRMEEMLRLVHNGVGKWRDDGITKVQYDKFPQKLKDRYRYVEKLPESDWLDFKGVYYKQLYNALLTIQGQVKKDVREDDSFSPDIDVDIN